MVAYPCHSGVGEEPADGIGKLALLNSQGVITDAEFEQQKAMLLA